MDDFAIIRAKIAEKAKENNLELTDRADATCACIIAEKALKGKRHEV